MGSVTNPIVSIIIILFIMILSLRLALKRKTRMWLIPFILYTLYLIMFIVGLHVQSTILENMKRAMNLVGWISIWSITWSKQDEDIQTKGENAQVKGDSK